MNIISIGCSWTYGLGVEKSQTYPAHLQDLIPGATVINGGHAGSDIDHAIYTGLRLIDEYDPKICIFEITTLDRITIGTDGNKFFNGQDFRENDLEQQFYYDTPSEKKYIRLQGIGNENKTKLAIGNLLEGKRECKQNYETTCCTTSLQSYRGYIETAFRDVVLSPYSIQKIKDSLTLFHAYLQSRKILPFYFFWLPIDNVIQQNLWNESFMEKSVKEYLEQNYPDRDFFIDNGFHLSSKGNEIVAKDIVYPRIKYYI